MRLVYLNGEFVPETEAKISVFDRGFLYGDGIFETIRAYNGRPFQLDRHLERLHRSAEIIALRLPHGPGRFAAIVEETLQANGLLDATVRLSVSRGQGPPGLSPELCGKPTVVCTARDVQEGIKSKQEAGVRAVFVSTRRTPPQCLDCRAKTFNFLNNLLARIEADAAGAFEGIMLNSSGQVTEGTVSNVFFCGGGTLYTPSVEAGVLPGIARETVLEVASSMSIEKAEGFFTAADLYAAEEIFLTNSNWEVMPVVELDGRAVGTGTPGAVTARLAQGYRELVNEGAASP